jgi:hypothetical protein
LIKEYCFADNKSKFARYKDYLNEHFKNSMKLMPHLLMCLNCFVVFIGCNFSNNKTGVMKLKPIINKIYKYSILKTSKIQWTYNGTAHTKYDTVVLNFSMQKTNKAGSLISYNVTYNRFRWNTQVNYSRDLLHAKPVTVLMNDSGTVVQVLNTDELLQDIEKDSITQSYVSGVLPDYISENGVKDLFNKIFAVLPVKKINENDTWVRNKIMIAKAPVFLSNLYTLKTHTNDSATINIQSIISARQSAGDVTYLKGDENGYAILSYSTGMPFLFETQSDVVTTTNYYDIKNNEHIVVRLN